MTVGNPAQTTAVPGAQPSSMGLQGWTYDPAFATQSSPPSGVAGRLQLARVRCPAPFAATAVRLYVATAGATLTAGQNLAGLYTAAGSLIAPTADLSSGANSFLTADANSFALTGGPFNLPAGDYYVAWYYNGTTAPAFARAGSINGPLSNLGQSAPGLRFAIADTGLTTALPASFGSQSIASNCWWAGIS